MNRHVSANLQNTQENSAAFELIGIVTSPYSIKLRSALRSRHLKHVWRTDFPPITGHKYPVRPNVVPILRYPDSSLRVDSTLILIDLDTRLSHLSPSWLPVEPAVAFLSDLIEDFADEWLCKSLFHYRWSYERDAHNAADWIALELYPGDTVRAAQVAQSIRVRQIERMPRVGCIAAHTGLLEGTYRRVLSTLKRHLEACPFLFGATPSPADFAIYGQLSQLAVDPTPADIMRLEAPNVRTWVDCFELFSAHGRASLSTADALRSPDISELISLATDVYLPYLRANEVAVTSGRPDFRVCIEGVEFSQPSFVYHVKCLETLRSRFQRLSRSIRGALEGRLPGLCQLI